MKTIALYNNKGGVGKSTSVINIAYILAIIFGYRVLVADTDGQQNTARFFADALPDTGVEDLLLDNSLSPAAALSRTRYKRIDLLSSTDRMNRCAEQFCSLSPKSQHQHTERLLSYFRDSYDYLLVDMPPALNCVTETLLGCADGVLVPIELGTFSIQGIAKVTNSINRVGGSFLGCYIAKYDHENKADADLKELLTDTLGSKVFDAVIPYSRIIRNSTNYRLTAYEYMHWQAPVKRYIELTDEIIRKVD